MVRLCLQTTAAAIQKGRGTGLRATVLSCWVLVSMCGLFPGCDILDDDEMTGPVSDTEVVIHLLLSDSDLAGQSLIDPDSRIQVARWSVASATLSFGNVLIDLVDEEQACVFSDTAFSIPIAEGPCESGLLIEAGDDEAASLMLTLDSMELRRAKPLDLSHTVDFDFDGVPNDGDGSGSAFDAPCGLGGLTLDCDDNCPLVSNPDQADTNGDGIGDVCTMIDPSMGALRYSDGDGVSDEFDNCVWIYNPGQEDTGDGMVDGIGDACLEQVAQVHLAGELAFELTLGPADLALQPGLNVVLTVDFRSSNSLRCDWDARVCALDPSPLWFAVSHRRALAT